MRYFCLSKNKKRQKSIGVTPVTQNTFLALSQFIYDCLFRKSAHLHDTQ